MLLNVSSLNTRKHGTILDVWYVGGEHKYVQRPFDPFFFSLIKMPRFPNEKVQLTDLATFKEIDFYKVSFQDTKVLKQHADPDFTTDDDIPYVQNVVIEEGFEYKSPNPSHYAFDIETWKGKIVAIAFYGKDGKEYAAGKDEAGILRFLNRMIDKYNPDLLDTYWGAYFDVGKVVERSHALKIPIAWGRDEYKSPPFIRKRTYRRGPKQGVEKTVKIKGRIHFDVWREVDLDQTLSGIKDKKLGTVAEWFKLPPKAVIDYDHMDQMTDDDLGRACLNHAEITWRLSEMYLQRLYYFCDTLDIPLNLILERTPSHIPNYIYMKDMRKLGVISRAKNFERFPQFFQFGRKAYQGAYTKLFQAGIFGLLRHADFRSMYPTIMAVFNLSPETVRLLSVEHLVCTGLEKPVFKDDEIWIYDDKVGLFKCRIREEEGVSKKHIREWMAYRKTIKKQLKENPGDPALESSQYGVKVKLNTIYGYHGMRYARYGSVPIAGIITGIGRWWMWETIRWLEERGCTVIENDTDGVYYIGPDYSKELTEHFRSLIPERYDPSLVEVSGDEYQGGIFYEEKSYILNTGEKLLFHGSGLKGRHLPKICDNAGYELAQSLFDGEEVKSILWKYTKLKKYPLSDFALTVELHKNIAEYKDGTMIAAIIKQAEDWGIHYRVGSEIKYLKTKTGYMPFEIAEKLPGTELDYIYYRKRLAAVLSRILGPTKKMSRKTIEMIIKEGQMIL